MGIQDISILYRDGRMLDSAGAIRRIPAETLDALIRKMAALNTDKQCSADSAELCFDCFYYQITIHRPSGNEVIAMNELQMYCDDSVSALARSLRDLAFSSRR